jgi:hypothetical protein|nr:MAG TPA: hypothetical protein [Caudoviricetes sp.]
MCKNCKNEATETDWSVGFSMTSKTTGKTIHIERTEEELQEFASRMEDKALEGDEAAATGVALVCALEARAKAYHLKVSNLKARHETLLETLNDFKERYNTGEEFKKAIEHVLKADEVTEQVSDMRAVRMEDL